jgi:hypothetical protein
MDETVQSPQPTYQPPAVVPTPTYAPTPQSEPKKGKKTVGLLFVVLAIILILGGVFYFLGKKGESEDLEASPTPQERFTETEPTTEPSPSESPEAEVDKAKVKIMIQNGTGIAKEASYLSDKLKVLGYEDIDSSNADKQDYTATTVTFSSKLASSVVSELTKELEKVYQDVNTTKSSSLTVDVKIITGLRKGATSKPSASATPKSTATSSASPTASSSPTPTATTATN